MRKGFLLIVVVMVLVGLSGCPLSGKSAPVNVGDKIEVEGQTNDTRVSGTVTAIEGNWIKLENSGSIYWWNTNQAFSIRFI